jgi:hypothetical protein
LGLGEARDIRLSKEYLVYGEDYSYDGALPRGYLAVLFDLQGLDAALSGIREGGSEFIIRFGGRALYGNDAAKGETLFRASIIAPGRPYRMRPRKAATPSPLHRWPPSNALCSMRSGQPESS